MNVNKKKLEYAETNVDSDAKATLICDDSFHSKIHVSIKNNLKNHCIIKGSKGFIKISKNKKKYMIIDSNRPIDLNKKNIIEKIEKLIK